MKNKKAVEKIVLTKQEAKILEKAYDIAMDIKDESETIASDYANNVMSAISDLIEAHGNYVIGYEEENKNKQITFIAIDF